MATQLAKLQSALAALLMEPDHRNAFQADPDAYARRAGLKGKHAALLAGIPPEGTAYFASRRVIDRTHYLKGDLPRSVAAIESSVGLLATYFVDQPYAKEDPRAEVRQFRAWAVAAAKSGRIQAPLGDLANLEATGMLLMDKPYRKSERSTRLRKVPGIVVLKLRHDPDQLVDAEPLSAAAGRFPTALVREPNDVEVVKLDAVAAALVAAANGKRTAVQAVAALAPRFGTKAVRASLRNLRKRGVLSP